MRAELSPAPGAWAWARRGGGREWGSQGRACKLPSVALQRSASLELLKKVREPRPLGRLMKRVWGLARRKEHYVTTGTSRLRYCSHIPSRGLSIKSRQHPLARFARKQRWLLD